MTPSRCTRIPRCAHRRCALLVLLALGVGACAGPPTPPPPAGEVLRPAPAAVLADLRDDLDGARLIDAVRQSLVYLRRLPPGRTFTMGPRTLTAAQRIEALEELAAFLSGAPDLPALAEYIRRRFTAFQTVGDDGNGRVLFTGYYEPLLDGRRTPDAHYRVPVYPVPDDLIRVDLARFSDRYRGHAALMGRLDGDRVIPYHDRAAIQFDGVLAGRTAPLAWLQDPVALFFLQVQGSGRVRLADGTWLHLNYAAANGRPYRSIGRLLIEQGAIPREKMSMQAIRRYLEAHPDRLRAVLSHNPSYVFFRSVTQGPLGCLEVPLTPGRSLALDRRLFPEAALLVADIRVPRFDAAGTGITGWQPVRRLVVNQDTGGAIRGPGRADLFWGHGPAAELAAGHMQHRGTFYLLVPMLDTAGQNG